MRRFGALAGTIFAVALVVGILLLPSVGSDQTDDELVEELAGSGVDTIFGAYLITVATLASLVFVAIELRPRIESASADPFSKALGSLVQPAFLVMALSILVGGFALAAVAAQAFMDDITPNAQVARFMPGLGWGIMLVGGGLSAALGIAATSVHLLRTNWLPSWLGWFGIGCSIVLLGSVIFLPFVALPIWALVLSIALVTSKGSSA